MNDAEINQINEPFCVAGFPVLPSNENNLKLILSESQLMKVDTVFDNKAELVI